MGGPTRQRSAVISLLSLMPCLAGALGIPASTRAGKTAGSSVPAEVVKVYDGDTLKVRVDLGDGARMEKVRFLGIDAPETSHGGQGEMGAVQAAEALRRWLKGRRVRLILGGGPDHRDKYGRLLAYVEDETGSDAGLSLLKQGRVRLFRKFHHPREKIYRAAEAAARQEKIGLWAGGATGEIRRLAQTGARPIQVYPTGGDLWAVCLGSWARMEVPTARLTRLLMEIRDLQLRFREPALAVELQRLGFVAAPGCTP
ncbi:MAG: thermonuclease family protein [Acidobacteriota bacterium]